MKKLLLLLFAISLLAQNPQTAVFPGAVADDEDLLVHSNSAQTTLNGDINDSTLTIVLTSAANFTFPGVITIGTERIKVCSKATNTLTVCTGGRGFEGTSAAAHSSGVTVYGYMTAMQNNQLAAEVKAIEAKLPTGTTPPFWKNESSGTMSARNSGDTDYAPFNAASVDTGSGGSVGGMVSLGQGTAATPPANSVSLSAPTSVPTAYTLTFPSAIAAGAISTNGSGTVTFGDLGVADGGTGASTLTNHGVLLGQAASAVTATTAGTAGQVLTSGGASADPAWTTATYPGTVTSGRMLYASGANVVSDNANATISNGVLTLGQTTGPVAGGLVLYGGTSGTIAVNPAAVAGTSTLTIPAVTGTAAVAATSTTATQALFATTTAGAPEYRAIAVADLPTTTKTRVFGCVFDGGGSAVAQDSKCYMRLPVAGTIVGWSVVAQGTSPTCTIDVWKVASGTALPTVSDALTGSGDTHPALATGNALKSTDLTGWGSTTITADDIAGFNVDAVSAATWIEVLIYYTES